MEHPLVPPVIGIPLIALAAGACVAAALRVKRRATRRAWIEVAAALGGDLEAAPRGMAVRGCFRGYTAFLGEGVSFEDAAPYYHTRGALSIQNPARVVLGLRRKSLLEEYLTRHERSAAITGDDRFDRVFFVAVSVPEYAQVLLPQQVRDTLARWNDVEVYVKGNQIAWRRASTVRSARAMVALFEAIATMADLLAGLPPRELTLEQQQEEEKLIERGI